MVWAREEKRRGRVCEMVSGTQGDGNKEWRTGKEGEGRARIGEGDDQESDG